MINNNKIQKYTNLFSSLRADSDMRLVIWVMSSTLIAEKVLEANSFNSSLLMLTRRISAQNLELKNISVVGKPIDRLIKSNWRPVSALKFAQAL